jgi:hypothetical protein
MPSISIPAAIAGTGLVGSLVSANASQSAASTQANAADQASAAQLQMFNTIQGNLAPYRGVGAAAVNPLEYGLGIGGTQQQGEPGFGSLVTPFQPTMAQLQATPGYQFTQQQGMEQLQNSFAGQGLGGSGAALKAGANYAEGLASTTYQQQFQNYWTQNQNILSNLQGAVGVGQSAANQTGAFGTAATQASSNFLTSGAAASAAGTIGTANALNGGLGSLSNSAVLYGLGQTGLFGAGGGSNPYANPSMGGYVGGIPGNYG